MEKRWLMINLVLLLSINSLAFAICDPASPIQGTHEIEGEIIAIDANTIRILKSGVILEFKLIPQVKIICNGLSASWRALTPITPQAFFEAQVVLNGSNQVICIDGFYQGEECTIQGWFWKYGRLCLELSSTQGQIEYKFVNSEARLPKNGWLALEQLVFLLYSRGNEVRGVYLPD